MKTEKQARPLALPAEAPEDTAAEIERAVALEAIDLRRKELDEASKAASARFDDRADETIAATEAFHRLQRAVGAIGVELSAVTHQHAEAQTEGIEETLAGFADRGEISVDKLVEAEALGTRHRVLASLSMLLAETKLPLAEEAVLAATIEETVAQADSITCIADRRGFETELLLMEIAAEEGDAVLDHSRTVSGLLRAEAAACMVKVTAMREQLVNKQKARIAAAQQQFNRSIGRRF